MAFREASLQDIPQIQNVRHAVKENVLSDPGLVTDIDCANYLVKFFSHCPCPKYPGQRIILQSCSFLLLRWEQRGRIYVEAKEKNREMVLLPDQRVLIKYLASPD